MRRSKLFFKVLANVVLTLIVFFGAAVVLDINFDIIHEFDFVKLIQNSGTDNNNVSSKEANRYSFDMSKVDGDNTDIDDESIYDDSGNEDNVDDVIVDTNTESDDGTEKPADETEEPDDSLPKERHCEYCDAVLQEDETVAYLISGDYVEIRYRREATCVNDGYTGDSYCRGCNHLISTGVCIEATGHIHIYLQNQCNATCTHDGYTGDIVCLDCGCTLHEGSVISATGHVHTEIRDYVKENCTQNGYTGDEYCIDCGSKISTGTSISATGHIHTYVVGAADATYEGDGYTGDVYCSDCGAQVFVGEIIPRLKTPERIALESIIEDIAIIEQLSQQYNSSRFNQRVVIYIRSAKYSGTKWEIVGGDLESDFPNYVKNNQGSHDVTYLRSQNSIKDIVTGQSIDFIHMFATMSAIFVGKKEGDLGGWGGDLCQLTAEIAGKTSTLEELQELVAAKFNKSGSCFAPDDLLADVDAVNILTVYNQMPYNSRSISQAIYDYYNDLTQAKRLQMFSEYLFGTEELTHQEKCDVIYSRLIGNVYIKLYCKSVSIAIREGNANEYELKACISAFVNYLDN